jgi:hypothetical protein
LLVADSGSGKSPTWRLAVKPLLQKQREYSRQYDDAMNEYEIDLQDWKSTRSGDKPIPPIHRFCHISDTTTAALLPILSDNPFGVLASYNEATTWLGSFSSNGKDEGVYNDVFDGGSVSVNRKTGTRYILATHTHTSITGGVQPGSLSALLQKNPQFLFSGFLARFLMCQPPDVPRYFGDDPIPEPIAGAYHKLIDTLFAWRTDKSATPDDPCTVQLTPKARLMFSEYHNILADDRSSLTAGVMKSILSKMSGYALRLALTLHVADVASQYDDDGFPDFIPQLTEKTMRGAIILAEWYRREAQRILQRVKPGSSVTVDKETVAIMKHIKEREHATARSIAQYVSAFSGAGGMHRASEKLEMLAKDGLLVANNLTAMNGRPTRIYSMPYALTNEDVSDTTAENGVGSVGVVASKRDTKSVDSVGNRNREPRHRKTLQGI